MSKAGPCATLDYLLEDDSYASYVNYGGLPECDSFYNCKIVVTPFVVNKIPGGGWMFPKRSPFFSIFNQYFIELEASGVFLRISDFWNEKSHLPSQVCPSYDGTAIKIDKIISLFVLSAGGVVLSVLIFLYVYISFALIHNDITSLQIPLISHSPVAAELRCCCQENGLKRQERYWIN